MDTIKRECEVIILPSNEKLEVGKNMICKNYDEYLTHGLIINAKEYKDISIPQHLYIISDEEIKENDWFLSEARKTVHKCTGFFNNNLIDNHIHEGREQVEICKNDCKKIIASTNKSLNLPSISQGFIKKYCDIGGIDEVMVEYNRFTWNTRTNNEQCYFGYEAESEMQYCIEVIQPKLNSKGEVIISKIKDSWNREEVIELCKSAYKEGINYEMGIGYSINKWIKENL